MVNAAGAKLGALISIDYEKDRYLGYYPDTGDVLCLCQSIDGISEGFCEDVREVDIEPSDIEMSEDISMVLKIA